MLSESPNPNYNNDNINLNESSPNTSPETVLNKIDVYKTSQALPEFKLHKLDSKKDYQEEINDKVNLPDTNLNSIYNKKKNKSFATAKILKRVYLAPEESKKDDSTADKADTIISFRRKSSILERLESRSKFIEEEFLIEDGDKK